MGKYVVSKTSGLNGRVVVGSWKMSAFKTLLSFPLVAKGQMEVFEAPENAYTRVLEQKIFPRIGVVYNKLTENNSVRLESEQLLPLDVQAGESIAQTRAFTGRLAVPLLTHLESFNMPKPSDSNYGLRPIKPVVDVLRSFGISAQSDASPTAQLSWANTERLSGSDKLIPLKHVCREPSEVALMAAVARKGKTTIVNMAQDPDIVDLAKVYTDFAPAEIDGIGTSTWTIDSEGLDISAPYNTQAKVPGDHLEAATIAAAVAVVGGKVTIEGFDPTRILSIVALLREIGCAVEIGDSSITVESYKELKGTTVETQPFPGFPTDVQGPFLTVLSLCKGNSVLKENIWNNRLLQAAELNKLGAEIYVSDSQTAVINGVDRLYGTKVTGSCPRATAGLIIAGMVAEGVTEVYNSDLIDSAYSSLIENLQILGAQISYEEEVEEFRVHANAGQLEAL